MKWLRPAWSRAAHAPGAVSVRSVNYASSPLLAVEDAAVALEASSSRWSAWASCVLVGRAVYVQIVGTDFYLKQGEMRYARTLELPASRGRIIDRNGLILATSVPAPSVWAIPKDFEADTQQRAQLARLLGMTAGGAGRAQARRQPATSSGCERQVDEPRGAGRARRSA